MMAIHLRNRTVIVILFASIGVLGYGVPTISGQVPSAIEPVPPGLPFGSINDKLLINDVEKPGDGQLRKPRVRFNNLAKFASKASEVLARYEPNRGVTTVESLENVKTAKKFLGSLSEELAARAVLKLDSKERSQWTNLPVRPGAGGVRLGELNEEQLKLAYDLLHCMLSNDGYEKLRLIMLGDDELIRGRRRPGGIGTEAFSIMVFGEPHPGRLWAIQFDGHHIGLNIAVKGKQMTLGPSFLGAQPFEFEKGGHTIRPMVEERDIAFKLAQSLTEEQFRKTLALKQRGKIQAGPGNDGKVPKPIGISCSEFTNEQQLMLRKLIYQWVGWLPNENASARMHEILDELDEMKFSWNGPREDGSDVSYTIQSTSLLIEFAYQDLGGTPQQHLHTQYRNLKNEYGKNFR